MLFGMLKAAGYLPRITIFRALMMDRTVRLLQ